MTHHVLHPDLSDRLGRLGFGPRPTDPLTPPAWWKAIDLTGHDLVKATRACTAVEPIARAAGMTADEAALMHSFCLLLEAAVYTWDEQVETEQSTGAAPRRSRTPAVMLRLLEEIGCATPAARADVDDLRALFEAESTALSDPASPGVWDRVTRLRPADLRLQMRVILLCAGHDERTADAVVGALSPTLVALEIVDDVRSVPDDRESGGYNSYVQLRRRLSAGEARTRLEEVGRQLDEEAIQALAALEGPAFSCALAIAAGAGGPVTSRLLRVVGRGPRRALVALLHAAVSGDGRGTVGELRRLWPALVEDPTEDAA